MYDFETSNLGTKLDYVTTKFQTIERTLKDIQAESKKNRWVRL